jgi:hypothetical protein
MYVPVIMNCHYNKIEWKNKVRTAISSYWSNKLRSDCEEKARHLLAVLLEASRFLMLLLCFEEIEYVSMCLDENFTMPLNLCFEDLKRLVHIEHCIQTDPAKNVRTRAYLIPERNRTVRRQEDKCRASQKTVESSTLNSNESK